MNSVWLLKSGLLSLFVSLCLAASSTALAQSGNSANSVPADDKQLTQALLNEIKLLRQTLQRTSLSSFRAQVLTERLRVQQDQVSQLSRELEGLRAALADGRFGQPWMAERVKEVESQLERETDPVRRQQFERQSKQLQLEAERQAQRVAQQREREMQLTAKLQTEQAKLNELNERLDALERELEDLSAAEKAPAKSRKH